MERAEVCLSSLSQMRTGLSQMRTSAVIFIAGVEREAFASTFGFIYYTWEEGYFNSTMIDLMDICFSRNRKLIFQVHQIQPIIEI